ncbi:2-succinyl-5-enolpyruvyl-6-hydroxy-3-cyclohexene-1-carboxylic-acid synthase [Kineococcus rhizosphaerae]|uniref:2-succinyl-5-enolpyruvyl-6-hydroxy-3-cyclohexene-1-carboxylate synthase n=1 Tax=Kineococcus rhizosphaerae TaxID=559628 RepID=A0A2T0R594_9ACTN|nr:2-succinyl-5-enolpyruvyl-6-hydroxy-3-cyclohexene-1-carboxylic-acid synthase [Kineococcus rhizosphaerae]PRY15936.1 2-succinyl-5-enolpyruvyl-6-hydroxy-3-cyclohexene-1-carboxylate synthase [Kineococcus rhizosphaerae]
MNPSTAFATVLVDAFVRLGLRHLVLSPGSRSAPLAYAAARAADSGRLRLHVRVDERSAGFLALGLARAGELVAVVTTSGTAVANLHPAVLEAHHAGVPLVVLSADRPHELRGSGASQTAEAQPRMFLPSVRFSADLPAPVDPRAQAPAWRSVVSRAVAAARGLRGDGPGPVHLDVAFADPLTPSPDVLPESTTGLTEVAGLPAPQPVALPRGERTLVLAGDAPDPATGRAARDLAEHAGWPLLAEPSSGARGGERAVGAYRLLLDALDSQGPLGAVERVVLFGHPTLSRPVTRLLARDDVDLVVVSATGAWPDAGFRAARVLPAVTVDGPASEAEHDFAARWDRAAKLAADAIDAVVDDEDALTGPWAGREVVDACAADGSALVVAASNAVRDVDLAGRPLGVRTVSNRGLAGIDGTLATAEGVALGLGPTRLLVGDLAFLHDVNALLPVPGEQRPDLTVVLVNDDGGGIFETLEHAAAVDRATFERVVATPHGVDVAALCAAYGVPHVRPATRAEAAAAIGARPAGLRVVELVVDRATVRPRLERITAAVRAAVLDA